MRYLAAHFRYLGIVCTLSVLAGAPSTARTQETTVRGIVVDSDGVAIPNAAVAIVSLHRATRTDTAGRFNFTKILSAEIVISARRLGYAPDSAHVLLGALASDPIRITLAELPEVMSTMNVSASERHRRQRIEDFYWRRARGLGKYFTREEILARRASVPSDVLRTAPGIVAVRTRSGTGIRFTSAANTRGCVPMMWIDGERAPGMEIDEIPLDDIEGIELYNGPSTTPAEFWQAAVTQCGTIVVWTRLPGA